MGKKRSQLSDELPSFVELYRMYEELLILRREVDDEKARTQLLYEKAKLEPRPPRG